MFATKTYPYTLMMVFSDIFTSFSTYRVNLVLSFCNSNLQHYKKMKCNVSILGRNDIRLSCYCNYSYLLIIAMAWHHCKLVCFRKFESKFWIYSIQVLNIWQWNTLFTIKSEMLFLYQPKGCIQLKQQLRESAFIMEKSKQTYQCINLE